MPKQIYKIENFHGGLNSSSDPRDISNTELSSATDVMVDEVGRIRTMGNIQSTLVATKYKNIVKEMGDVAKKLEEGYKDGKLTKQEKDAVMKEVIDVMKSVLKAKWGLF